MRKLLHDTCSELDEHLTADETAELRALREQAQAGGMDAGRLERLVREAAARRTEQAVDEQMRRSKR